MLRFQDSARPALHSLLAECPHLQCLTFRGKCSPLRPLQAPSQLHCLAINDPRGCLQSLFTSEENIRLLASSLRALEPAGHFPYFKQGASFPPPQLARFTNLTYLGVEVTRRNEDFLPDTLPSLHNLRALAVTKVPTSQDFNNFLSRFPATCPQLEHLSLHCEGLPLEVIGAAVANFMHLKSLHMHFDQFYRLQFGQKRAEWGWLLLLARRGLLEYLHLEGAYKPVPHRYPDVPADVMAELVQGCKVGTYT